MENKMSNKQYFSKIGMRLFIGTLILNGVQLLFIFLAKLIGLAVPALGASGDFNFLMSMLPIYVIAFPIIFAMFKKIPVHLNGEKKKMKPSHLFAAFLICYATMYIFNILATILTGIIGALLQNNVTDVVATLTSTISLPVNLFILVICAPIAEELLFRKILIDRTAQFGEGVALVFSGITFGLFHGNLVQFAYAFFLGMLLGFIYLRTRNIIYTIILHMVINFFGGFVSTIIMNVSGLDKLGADASVEQITAFMAENPMGLILFLIYFLFLFVGVIAGIVIFIKNRKKFKAQPGEITIEKGKGFSTVILNLGMILYSIFWLGLIILQLLL